MANAQFKGYKTTINGKKAFVVNETDSQRKVIFGKLIGYTGWSGGAVPQYSFNGPKVWVNK